MIHASETKPEVQELPGDIDQTENALLCFTGMIIARFCASLCKGSCAFLVPIVLVFCSGINSCPLI